MKKLISKIFIMGFVFLLAFTSFSWKNIIYLANAEDDVNRKFEAIEIIEDELDMRGTSVAEELESQITYYRQMYKV